MVSATETGPPPTPPWWRTSLVGSLAVGLAVAIAAWCPWWQLRAALVAASFVFVYLLLRNPEHWARRLAATCLAVAAGAALLPDFDFWLERPGLTVIASKSSELVLGFLGAAAVFALLEVFRTRPRSPTPRHRQSVRNGNAVALGNIGDGAQVSINIGTAEDGGQRSRDNHDIRVKLALEELRTKRFREIGGVLLDTERFHFEELQPDSRFKLLRGLATFEVFQLNESGAAVRFRAAARLAPREARGRACLVRALSSEHRFDDAKEEVRAALLDHPTDLELWGLRVLLHADDETAEDLAKQAPETALLDPKVLFALGQLALQCGDRRSAYDYAKGSYDAGYKQVGNYFTLGTSLIEEYAQPEPWESPPLSNDPASVARLRRAIAWFDEGLDQAIGAPSEEAIVEQLAANKADALTFVGDQSVGQWLRQARERLPNSALIRRGYALWLAKTGAIDEAIELLRSVAKATQEPRASLDLALHLTKKGDVQSLRDAATIALLLLQEKGNVADTSIRSMALRLSVNSLLDLGRAQEAADNLAEAGIELADEVALLSVHVVGTLEGTEAERKAALAAAESLAGKLAPWDAGTLAARLASLDEFEAALKLIDSVPDARSTEALSRYRVHCTAQTRDEVTTLKCAREYRLKYGFNTFVLHTELDALDGDPSAAAHLMAEYLREHPDDRLVWLRRSSLGIRTARHDWVATESQRLPDPDACHPQHGRVAAQILAEAGQPDRALAYAFRLFRRCFDSGEAREALLDVIYKMSERPTLEHPEAVVTDSAVKLRGNHCVESWVIIESGAEPMRSRAEHAPSSDLALALLGKRVGDTVDFRRLGGEGGVCIVAIQDKHVYWAQQILRPSPVTSEVQGAMQPIPVGETVEDLREALHRLLAANRDDTEKLMAVYREHAAWSLHGIAERLGRTPFEAFVQLYESSDDVIRTPGELESARTRDAFSKLVVDDACLATLFFTETHLLLPNVASSLLIGPRLGAELRRFPTKSRVNRAHSNVALDSTGEIVVTAVTDEHLATARAHAQVFSDWASKNLFEHPVVWAEIDLAPRQLLEQVFGGGGLQSLAIARATHSPIATDDEALAMLATAVGVQVVSTLNLLRLFERRGLLAADQALRKRLLLAGSGYLGVVVSGADVLGAARLAGWKVSDPPLRDCFRFLFNRRIDADARLAMALALICVSFHPHATPELRRNIVATALWSVELFGVGDNTFEALLSRCRGALNPSDRVDFDRIVDARREILTPRTKSGLIAGRT